jgi:putative membrane protein
VNQVDPDGAGHRAAPQTRNELAQTRTSLAEDRTILANERSLLAWYRTAFGAYALSLGFGAILPSLRKGNPALGDLYVVAGICFALLGAGAALDGFLRHRRFLRKLNVFFTPHPPAGETARLMAVGVAITVLGVATALIIAIDRFG